MSEQPPSQPGGDRGSNGNSDPGSGGGHDPNAGNTGSDWSGQAAPPPSPPPYGQAGASWPNSQPAPPPPAYGQPAYDPNQPGMPAGAGAPPYGGPGGYGGPYIPPTPKQTSTGKIVAIVVGVVLLLVCGGCFAFGTVIYSTGRDIAREIESYEPPDDIDQVVSVAPGETFLVGDYSISPGWSVGTQGPVVTMEGMTATKIGAAQFDTVAFDMVFYRGDNLLGNATCSGTVPEDATDAQVACMVSDRKVRKADRVEIQSLI